MIVEETFLVDEAHEFSTTTQSPLINQTFGQYQQDNSLEWSQFECDQTVTGQNSHLANRNTDAYTDD